MTKNKRNDKRNSGRKIRADIKIERPRKVIKQNITKEEFLTTLEKFAQPVNKASESGSEKSQT